MIRNICYENIIDLISLHRLSQCLIGTVIIIGCWHHIDSHIFVLALLFSLLIYQTAVLLIYSSQQLQGSNKLLNSTIHSIDGVFCGIICLICISSNTLAVSISALFLLIYLQTLGLKALYGIVSLFCTVLICSNLDFKAYSLNSFCKLTELCEHSIYLILIVFLIIYSYLKNSYDHRLNSHLAQQFNKNNILKAHIFSLSKYLSPEISKSIIAGHEVKVESCEKQMTIFFSDMTGFCQLSEQLSNEKLTWLINTYLEEMSDIIFKFGGTLDKVIGDSIMVFFGDPHSRGESNDAVACVTMALAMNEAMQKLRHQWLDSGIKNPPSHRIGINTGFCKVGNFGTETKLDYTVMGTAVNLASHIESIANSNEIVLSEQTYQLVKDRIQCERKQDDSEWLAKSLRLYSVI
jgi:class 3 adenylate cyclase